jgi:hypothetical protein
LYRSDRTLLGQIQDTAVYWTGIIKKIWQLWCLQTCKYLRFAKNIYHIVTVQFTQCI